MIKQINAQVSNLPETQQEVLRLARDFEVSQEIYVQLLNRMQELNILKAGTVGNVRILDEAVANPIPVAPKKALIVVLAKMLEAQNKTIMVSGPAPAVGKSFVTTNFAAVLAQAGQKVVVIDGDIRRGYMHIQLGGNNKYGLSDFLADKNAENNEDGVNKLIQQTKVANLDFIPRGTAAPNPSELLMQSKMSALLDELNKHYDYVLIDTPPILAVTDAAIVGRYAGTSLLVARFGQTPAKEVEATVKRFAQNGVDVRGVILNGVQRRASGYYGYGYGYHYGYSYKSEQ